MLVVMPRTLFSGGLVFDGTGSRPSRADLVVEDGEVVDVGTDLDGDVNVDVTGCTLTPGLIDAHVHLTLSGSLDVRTLIQQPWSYRYFQIPASALATLTCGITTVRDAGGADAGVREAIDDGLFPGPRMQISIVMISQTGGHGDGWWPSGHETFLFPVTPGAPSGLADGRDEMRRKTRELIRAGADVLKVATSGGVLSFGDEPRHAQFSPDELAVLVTEAHAAGRAVMAHAQSTVGIRNAVDAGVRSIEHGIYLDDDTIAAMLERDVWLVPTLLAVDGVLARAEELPERLVEKARAVREAHRESVRRAVAAGVRIAMGTDCPVSPHGTNLTELALMVEAGMPPESAMAAATSSAADLLRRPDLGRLRPGSRADVVVVRGGIDDLGTLRERVEQVWMDGHRVS
jgi:imidazolonepropionase-like amidohydrolase